MASDRTRTTSRRAGSSLRALIALNVALLLVLALVALGPAVLAQARGRGVYTMTVGGVRNSQSSAVYIVDTVHQELMVVRYDGANRQLEGVGYRDLAGDAEIVTRSRARPGG